MTKKKLSLQIQWDKREKRGKEDRHTKETRGAIRGKKSSVVCPDAAAISCSSWCIRRGAREELPGTRTREGLGRRP